ncbi:hypothetical protein BDY19DRAFT_940744, partial [Irpex rosettiformis]
MFTTNVTINAINTYHPLQGRRLGGGMPVVGAESVGFTNLSIYMYVLTYNLNEVAVTKASFAKRCATQVTRVLHTGS